MLSPAPGTDSSVLAVLGDHLLATDPALKVAFDTKFRADAAFAADPTVRLAWFYERAGPGHPYRLRYPIARELN
jgi:hypothetical protein